MRCGYCQAPAGWLARVCRDCRRLLALYNTQRGRVGPIQLFDLFIATGLPREQIEAFLAADQHGTGSIQDHILAEMSTDLLAALGVNARQRPEDVKRLRARGAWRDRGERPKE